jgi:hypothetical protein
MSRFGYSEPFLLERINKAKAYARLIIRETPRTEDELFDHYKVLLCHHYNVMFHDCRWELYTLDEIALEWFLIEEQNKPVGSDVSEELVKEHKDDLSAMADEMEFGEAQDLPVDESQMEDMKNFMETGVFKGENHES